MKMKVHIDHNGSTFHMESSDENVEYWAVKTFDAADSLEKLKGLIKVKPGNAVCLIVIAKPCLATDPDVVVGLEQEQD